VYPDHSWEVSSPYGWLCVPKRVTVLTVTLGGNLYHKIDYWQGINLVYFSWLLLNYEGSTGDSHLWRYWLTHPRLRLIPGSNLNAVNLVIVSLVSHHAGEWMGRWAVWLKADVVPRSVVVVRLLAWYLLSAMFEESSNWSMASGGCVFRGVRALMQWPSQQDVGIMIVYVLEVKYADWSKSSGHCIATHT